MCQYKIIASILLILPIINFVLALPMAVQKTRQLCGDVVPDVAITMSAKRGHGDEMEKQGGMYFESLSGNPESELAGLEGLHPFDGLQRPPQMGTSEIQQVSSELSTSPSLDHHVVLPELSKIPILDHYLVSQELSKSPILEQYMVPPEPSKSPSLDHHTVVSTNSESGPSPSAASESGQPESESTTSSPMEKPDSGKEFSELKFWRRISGQAPSGML